MSNPTRAPASQDEQVLAIVNELRRSDARGRLLMFEVMYAFDLFDKRVGGWNQEDRNILRAKVEAIRAHLFPKRG